MGRTMLNKTLVVMTTFIGKGVKRSNRLPPEQVMSDVLDTLYFHEKYENDHKYDFLIVDNSSNHEPWLSFLSNSKYKSHTRENTGMAPAGLEYAFDLYKEKYRYFLLHEQDCYPTQNGWLDLIHKKFKSDDQCGAVGNLICNSNFPPLKGKKHLCGTFFFSSSKILKECGFSLEHQPNYDNAPHNEVLLCQPIVKHGYKLLDFASDEYVYHFTKHNCYNYGKAEKLAPFLSSETAFNSDLDQIKQKLKNE